MDRFDLEQQISSIINVCDDLNLLTENILENEMDTDEVVNALIGISIVLKMRHDKIFDVFKQTFKLDQYRESNAVSSAKY